MVIIKIGKEIIKFVGTVKIESQLKSYYQNFIWDMASISEKECEDINVMIYDIAKYTIINKENSDVSCVSIPFETYKAYIKTDLQKQCIDIWIPDEIRWNDWEFCFRVASFPIFLKNDQLVIHSAGIQYLDKVYLITGESGAGKTTAVRNCVQENNGVIVLNDDTMVLYKNGSEWYASSAPYQSTSGIKPVFGGAKLAGIYRIHKADNLFRTKMSKLEVIQQIWTHCFAIGSMLLENSLMMEKLLCNAKDISITTDNFHIYASKEEKNLLAVMLGE